MRGFRRMPAQTGKQGLFRLVKQAQESYTAEVATRQKSYRRYVLDFIHSKRYHDETDAWSKNEHLKNYRTIVDLLRGHEKLVRKYFEQEVFDDHADFRSAQRVLHLRSVSNRCAGGHLGACVSSTN